MSCTKKYCDCSDNELNKLNQLLTKNIVFLINECHMDDIYKNDKPRCFLEHIYRNQEIAKKEHN